MNIPKISFFDDPKNELWIKKQIIVQDPQITGQLLRTNKKGITKEGLYAIMDDKLIYKHKHLVLSNITYEKTKPNSFKLTRNRKSIEFQTTNEQSQRLWHDFLKLYSIQRGFNNIYTINKLIGKGNFAKVYSAIRKSDNSIYAVKAFDKLKFADIKVDKPALVKELSIMRIMDFKGVIKLFEVYENDSYIFLVCELLEGGELFNHMKGKAYDETIVANIIFRILQSIDYIHAKNVLHRDIKPENLILRTKNDLTDVVIADFGLADYYNPQGEYMFKRCGTPGYVAPELLQDKIYDFKVDIFSAGVLMFIMLTGQSPFKAKSYDEIVMKNYHCEIEYALLQTHPISQEAMQLLKLLLDKNPEHRISAEIALQHPWFLNQPNYQLYLDDNYIRHKRHSDMYARTPLMNQELNQSITSTPQSVTPQMRSKSNTADICVQQQQKQDDNAVQFRTPSQSVKFKVNKQPSIINEETDYNVYEEDDLTHGNQLKMYQIQPKLKKQHEEYNSKEARNIRDSLQQNLK